MTYREEASHLQISVYLRWLWNKGKQFNEKEKQLNHLEANETIIDVTNKKLQTNYQQHITMKYLKRTWIHTCIYIYGLCVIIYDLK